MQKALNQLKTATYTVDNVKDNKSVSDYVQNILRLGFFAELGIKAVLHWAWNNLASTL